MSDCYYYYAYKAVAFFHLVIIFLNMVSVPLLIAYQPFYIWIPMISLLASPVIGGTHCIINRLENKFRVKAGVPVMYDRLEELFKKDN